VVRRGAYPDALTSPSPASRRVRLSGVWCTVRASLPRASSTMLYRSKIARPVPCRWAFAQLCAIIIS